MCVTVPVAPISRSPPTSDTPIASPSRSADAVGAVCSADAADAPVTNGTKPASRKAPEIRSTVADSKPLIISGVAIGRSIAPIWAPAADGQADGLNVGRALD